MQTFLPFPDYSATARVLDMKRLGKQRVETYQLLLNLAAVSVTPEGLLLPRERFWWHPALAQWVGHELSLLSYQEAICDEWTSRGYCDSTLEKSRKLADFFSPESAGAPPWLGDDTFHRSHQSNLLRKDYSYYSQHFLKVPSNLPYSWPRAASGAKAPLLARKALRERELS